MAEVGEADVAAFANGDPLRAELAEVLAPLLGVPVWTLTQQRPEDVKYVFVLLAAAHEPFQVQLAKQLRTHLDKQGLHHRVLTPVVDFVWDEYRRLEAEIRERYRVYAAGIIVAPTWSPEQLGSIWNFAAWLGIPVMLVDRNPPVLERRWPSNVCYISAKDYRGGWLAGRWLAHVMSEQHRGRQSALVMTGPVKHERALGAIEAIEAYQAGRVGNSPALPGLDECLIRFEDRGDYTQATAAAQGLEHMVKALKRRAPVTVALATSRLMAEGLADAADELVRHLGCARPVIAGYDAEESLLTGRVQGAVVQDVDLIAKRTAEQLMRRLYFLKRRKQRQVLVAPRLVTAMPRGAEEPTDPVCAELNAEMVAQTMRLAHGYFRQGKLQQARETLRTINGWLAQHQEV